MAILTTRVLRLTDEAGDERDLLLTIFVPVQSEPTLWMCDFEFDPPIPRRTPPAEGADFLEAFIMALHHARICLEAPELRGRVHWDGMAHCGLPEFEERRPMLNLDVLTTRALAYADEQGGEREMRFTVFVPFHDKSDGLWKCGFMFGPPAPTPVNYGWGKDFMEALLDALAIARKAYETLVPKARAVSGDLFNCDDLPKVKDRSFRLTRPAAPQRDE